ncbi:MAG TPA: FAD-dependent oxidoreductase [Candidatus Limnocylindrales bacterium]|jgi:protoporphyrinogen oxidase
MTRPRAAVIGGGISGLATAVRLTGLGHQVTLYEAEPGLGGLGTTFPYEDGHLEKFYHCILPDDDALLGFIRELGLEGDLLWRRTDMGFMHDRRTYPLNTPVDLLRFSPLPFVDRIRMGLLGIRARLRGRDPALDDRTVSEWLISQVGQRAFDTVWRPLLEAKVGDSYPGIPALWLSSRMNREKSTKLEVKGCLVHGYRSLIDAFERYLVERGTIIRTSTRVTAVSQEPAGMRVATEHDSTGFDHVVVTLPLVQFQSLTRGIDLPAQVADIRLDYQGVVSGVFLLDKPLTSYYWMPVVSSGATCQGIIEMSNLVPLERSQGRYVTYLVNYTHRESALFARSDDDLLAAYRADLAALFPGSEETIVDAFLFRAPFVEPIWTVGYQRVKPPTSIIPGRLYLASTAQVYPRVNSWDSSCEVVEGMIETLAIETVALREAEASPAPAAA